jgi:hypothetical protein
MLISPERKITSLELTFDAIMSLADMSKGHLHDFYLDEAAKVVTKLKDLEEEINGSSTHRTAVRPGIHLANP